MPDSNIPKKIIITGGAGFIGSNAAASHLRRGNRVVIIDNLSRKGGQANLDWLRLQGPFEFIQEDVRNAEAMLQAFKNHSDADVVLHAAAQVAVTTSVTDPRLDFETNALGTLNVLEALRTHAPQAVLLYTSTNKVFGDLEYLAMEENELRYAFADSALHANGISESCPLDFHSPYGCSKGSADQYVRDYHRMYGLKTVVFRQSCIYGTRQIGVEDQGWVAWFLIRAILGQPVTIYGNGKQVRDILYIDDLIDAYDRAVEHVDRTSGKIYNMGGGAANAISLLEFMALIKEVTGRELVHTFSEQRPGDQKIFVADTALAQKELAWRAQTGYREGVAKLHDWLSQNRSIFESAA
jgi:CDP-paratose 2-epimerase